MSFLIKPRIPQIDHDNPFTRGLVFDLPIFEHGNPTPQELFSRLKGSMTGSNITPTTSPIGKAINSAGTTAPASYISGNSIPSQNGLVNLSVEFIAKVTTAGGNYLFGKGTTGGSYWSVREDSGTNSWAFEMDSWTNAPAWGSNNGSMVTGKFQHVIVTMKGLNTTTNTPSFYIDGVPKNSYSFSVSPTGSQTGDDTTYHLLSNGDTTGNFNGAIALFRYWNRVLSYQEALLLYQNPFRIYKKTYIYPINANVLAGGNNFTLNLSDTVTLTESFSKETMKVFSESISLSETFTKQPQKVFSESISLIESFIRSTTKVFSTPLTLVETIAKLTSKTFTESALSLTETFSYIHEHFLNFTDSITLTESFSKMPGKVFSLSISLVETFIRSTTKVFSDSLSLTETFSYIHQHFLSFTDIIVPSDSGYALQFDGSQNYVQATGFPQNNDELSISIWMNESSYVSGKRATAVNSSFEVDLEGVGAAAEYKLRLFDSTGASIFLSIPNANGNPSSNAGQLVHLVWVASFSGNYVKGYINGVLQFTTTYPNASPKISGTSILYLGRYASGNYFNGILDKLLIWNKALTDTEAASLYDNEPLPQTANLQLEWLLDEGSGSIATDSSGNGRNGTLSGSPIPVWVSGLTSTKMFTKLTTKVLNETLSLTETFTRFPQKVLSDPISLTETFIRSTTKVYNDTISLIESLAKLTSKVFTETINLSDSIIRSITKVFVETPISLVETFSSQITNRFRNINAPKMLNAIGYFVKGSVAKFYNSPTGLDSSKAAKGLANSNKTPTGSADSNKTPRGF